MRTPEWHQSGKIPRNDKAPGFSFPESPGALGFRWWARLVSNQRPLGCEPSALTAELRTPTGVKYSGRATPLARPLTNLRRVPAKPGCPSIRRQPRAAILHRRQISSGDGSDFAKYLINPPGIVVTGTFFSAYGAIFLGRHGPRGPLRADRTHRPARPARSGQDGRHTGPTGRHCCDRGPAQGVVQQLLYAHAAGACG